MIGTSDRISLVNQIWPNKRRGWRKEEEEKEDEGNREARGLRAGGLARTVALRACISMREGCEKGGRSKEEEREERMRTRKEGRKREGLDEVQEQEDKGKKTGKKGLFELSLCAKQLPGLPGRERRTALCSFTCRPTDRKSVV